MKILVKDDYGIYRKGISEIIKDHYPDAIVMEAGSTTYLFEEINSTGCDLIITSFDRQENATAAFQFFKQKFPKIPVIVFGSNTNALWIAGLMANGANAYLNRNCSPGELTAAIDKATCNKAGSCPTRSSTF